MERYSEVIGLPVICVDHGKKIGVIEDIIFCPATKEVKAFLLEKKGCRISKKAIELEDVLSMGRDALVVDDCKCVKNYKKNNRDLELKDNGSIRGLRIFTKTGEDIGVVKDVLFDYKTGCIEGVEVSDGLLQDLVQGRNILPLFGKVEFSDESILVEREAVEEMTSTGGGLRKKFFDDT